MHERHIWVAYVNFKDEQVQGNKIIYFMVSSVGIPDGFYPSSAHYVRKNIKQNPEIYFFLYRIIYFLP
jgi:hypothetical protein